MRTWDKEKIGFALLFLIGIAIMTYPLTANLYYSLRFAYETRDYEVREAALPAETRAAELARARAYNQSLDPSHLADPFSEATKEGIRSYAAMLDVHQKLGVLEIPALAAKLPIYAGTDLATLNKGVGHLEGTSLPVGGAGTHAVLVAHRGYAKAKLFRHLDRLQVGDVFYVHAMGETLAYEVDRQLTVEPSDFKAIAVRSGHDEVTLLTCTPFRVNSHRLLVRGHRVPYVPPSPKQPCPYRWALLAIAVVGVGYCYRKRRKKG